jgi:hypothetical protein
MKIIISASNLENDNVVELSTKNYLIDRNSLEWLDKYDTFISTYERITKITLDLGGDDLNEEIDLPDVFDTEQDAKIAVQVLKSSLEEWILKEFHQ